MTDEMYPSDENDKLKMRLELPGALHALTKINSKLEEIGHLRKRVGPAEVLEEIHPRKRTAAPEAEVSFLIRFCVFYNL